MVLVLHFYYHYNFGITVASNAPKTAPVLQAATGAASAGGAGSGLATGALVGGAVAGGGGSGAAILTGVVVAADLEAPLVGGSVLADLGTLGLAGGIAAGQAAGAFSSTQQTELTRVQNSVKQNLQNPQCAKVLGGLKRAMALFNRAQVMHANSINPAFAGSGGIYKGVARQAFNIAKNAKSNILAWSEIGGKYIYLNDRFFSYYTGNPAKEETVFIHELHRLGGFRGTDKADYAKIMKGCGTPNPY
jgi:hypothetical protein